MSDGGSPNPFGAVKLKKTGVDTGRQAPDLTDPPVAPNAPPALDSSRAQREAHSRLERSDLRRKSGAAAGEPPSVEKLSVSGTASVSPPSPKPSLEELLGGVDPKLIAAQNATTIFKIAYLTAGSRADPCVVVPPGGGATKEETLFWARELATIGPFFVVMYDLRGTGGSEPRDRWASAFTGTTPVREMERVLGMPPARRETEGSSEHDKRGTPSAPTAGGGRDGEDRSHGGLRTHARKHKPAPLDPRISNGLPDFDGYALDAFWVLDDLGIEKAHFVGLSQGGMLARLAATLRPERVLSVVSCGSAASKLGLMMAAFSAGAEEFGEKLKAAKLYDEDGRPPWGGAGVRRATRDEYVAWRSALIEIVVPDFDRAVYAEMAGGSWDAGYMDESECAIAALAYEAWERQGKDTQHLAALAANTRVPIMFVHGKKDPVIHAGESQKLYAQTGHCVLETHEYGHNFGPPSKQTALLGRMARFMKSGGGGGAGAGGAGGGGGGAATTGGGAAGSSSAATSVGSDTYASGVSRELRSRLSVETPTPDLWEAFCTVQTAADTGYALEVLLAKLGLSHMRGTGLQLLLALRPALEGAGLKFSQQKLLKDLHASMLRAQKVVAAQRGLAKPDAAAAQRAAEETAARSASGGFGFNEVLVCGAGPVGLRAACELALLGFRVTVIEKRPNFSRANILTFWDETMSDMLALGAKSYFPSLQPTGSQKFLGTRQIQVCLLKTFLLCGGVVRYGMEICGLLPPDAAHGKWRASFRPYVKHRRAAETEAVAKRSAEQEATTGGAEDAADPAAAVEFQQAKDYGGKEACSIEAWAVDEAYLDGRAAAAESGASSAAAGGGGGGGGAAMDEKEEPPSSLAPVPFDAYVIAEGGWSDSTRKLGFSKSVEIFKPVFGLVANLKYDPRDLKQKNMRSQIHFVLGADWPLSNCPIQAEFIEYLKGETHFFALVVSKKNHHTDQTESYLEKMTPEQRAAIPDEMIAQLRRASEQKGLVEMGVLRKSYGSALACLAADNVDTERLHQMVRDITHEMGLPASTELYQTNPIQLFDFSRRARCIDPVRVLCGPPADGSSGPTVLAPADFAKAASSGPGSRAGSVQALVLPVGDALQEPVWTQGTGINRGFHTAMNQAFACLVAREANLQAAVRESCAVQESVVKMRWGMGHSGLAGSGKGSLGLKPFKEWDANPRSRLPIV